MVVKPDFLVLFDGTCNLCNRNMLFLIAHNPAQNLMFCPVQSASGMALLRSLGMSTEHHETMLFLERDAVWQKSDAIIHIAQHLSWPWRWINWGKYVPRRIRDRLYSLLANNRYKIMGRREVCALPRADIAKRFIDG